MRQGITTWTEPALYSNSRDKACLRHDVTHSHFKVIWSLQCSVLSILNENCFTYHNFFRFQYACNFFYFLVKVLFFFKTVIILGKRVTITSQKNQPRIYTKFILFQSSSLSTWHSLVSQDSWVQSGHLGVLLISLNMGKEFHGLEKEHMKGNKRDRKVQWHL